MSVFDPQKTPREDGGGVSDLDAEQSSAQEEKGGHGRWLMIACCVPMLTIAIVLVATGVAGAGFIVAAVACTAMMAVMMVAMFPGGRGK
jgi:hypothetical protein